MKTLDGTYYPNLLATFLNHSTVTKCVINDHIYRDGVLISSNTTYWRFDIIITTS